MKSLRSIAAIAFLASSPCFVLACTNSTSNVDSGAASTVVSPTVRLATSSVVSVSQEGTSLPPAADPGVDGFSGQDAYEEVQRQVDFGPRPPATAAIHRLQDYLITQLKSYGCQVETDDFHSDTPLGRQDMKNILAKIPGASANIILLGTHYDTDTLDQNNQNMNNFVGADDAGSSTAVMLEIARVLCAKPPEQPATIWIAFFDGEEALQHWSDTDGTYGSREMAARLALSRELPKVKAFVLADMVGGRKLILPRESKSAPWLVNIFWSNAAKLGFKSVFANQSAGVQDDHTPFIARNIPCIDLIGIAPDTSGTPAEGFPAYWHTPGDTMDKISSRSLQIVGDVILSSLPDIAHNIH